METPLLIFIFAILGYIGGTIAEALHFKAHTRLSVPTDQNYVPQSLVTASYLRRAWMGIKLIAGFKVSPEQRWVEISKKRATRQDGYAFSKATPLADTIVNEDGQICGVITRSQPNDNSTRAHW